MKRARRAGLERRRRRRRRAERLRRLRLVCRRPFGPWLVTLDPGERWEGAGAIERFETVVRRAEQGVEVRASRWVPQSSAPGIVR